MSNKMPEETLYPYEKRICSAYQNKTAYALNGSDRVIYLCYLIFDKYTIGQIRRQNGTLVQNGLNFRNGTMYMPHRSCLNC